MSEAIEKTDKIGWWTSYLGDPCLRNDNLAIYKFNRKNEVGDAWLNFYVMNRGVQYNINCNVGCVECSAEDLYRYTNGTGKDLVRCGGETWYGVCLKSGDFSNTADPVVSKPFTMCINDLIIAFQGYLRCPLCSPLPEFVTKTTFTGNGHYYKCTGGASGDPEIKFVESEVTKPVYTHPMHIMSTKYVAKQFESAEDIDAFVGRRLVNEQNIGGLTTLATSIPETTLRTADMFSGRNAALSGLSLESNMMRIPVKPAPIKTFILNYKSETYEFTVCKPEVYCRWFMPSSNCANCISEKGLEEFRVVPGTFDISRLATTKTHLEGHSTILYELEQIDDIVVKPPPPAAAVPPADAVAVVEAPAESKPEKLTEEMALLINSIIRCRLHDTVKSALLVELTNAVVAGKKPDFSGILKFTDREYLQLATQPDLPTLQVYMMLPPELRTD